MGNPTISRRQLFRGDLRGDRAPTRPPWAIPEAAFTAACDRCSDCIDACPERILRVGDGGFPILDFAVGGCNFCAECHTACGGKALKGDPRKVAPWVLKAKIHDDCLAFRGVVCRSCGEACDEGAIRFRPRVGGVTEPILISDKCTGCGYCVKVCPVQAVRIEISAYAETAKAV